MAEAEDIVVKCVSDLMNAAKQGGSNLGACARALRRAEAAKVAERLGEKGKQRVVTTRAGQAAIRSTLDTLLIFVSSAGALIHKQNVRIKALEDAQARLEKDNSDLLAIVVAEQDAAEVNGHRAIGRAPHMLPLNGADPAELLPDA